MVLLRGKAMIALKDLKRLAGRLTRMRWVVSRFWATITETEHHAKDVLAGRKPRPVGMRGGDKLWLVAEKRVERPLKWLECFWGSLHSGFERHFEDSLPASSEEITIDASPWGLGGVLEHSRSGTTIEWFSSMLTPADEARFGHTIGEAAGQTTWEALALLMAVRAWAKFLVNKKVQMKLRGDNIGALRLAMKLASSHKALNGIGAELALTLEVNGMQEILTSHLPGRLNVKADTLSRVGSPKGPKSVPEEFRHIKERKLPIRDNKFFVAWDFAVN